MEQHDRTGAVCDACRRIPITHLALDIDEPIEGWLSFLAERRVQVFDDALGRPSVPRYVLRDLIGERRERGAWLAEEAAAKAAMHDEPLPVGIPALEGATAYETMMSAIGTSPAEEFGSRPRPNFLAEELEAGQRHAAAAREAVRRRKEAK